MGAGKAKDGGSRRWWALILLCVAQFVDVLDINAVIVALPTIGRELGFSHGDLQWVVTSYVLFFGGFLIFAGRLADLFGRRRMFVVGLALFAASSLLCGLAGSPLVLVAFRAAQGLGAAIVAPAALAIISTIFREGRGRNFAMGVWTAVAAGGGAAGRGDGHGRAPAVGLRPHPGRGSGLRLPPHAGDNGPRPDPDRGLPLRRAQCSRSASPPRRLPGAGPIWLGPGSLHEHGDDQPGGHPRHSVPAGGPGLLADPGGAFRVASEPLGRGRFLSGLPPHGYSGSKAYHGAGAGGHLWRNVAHHRDIRRG